jgi:hypothetical protein
MSSLVISGDTSGSVTLQAPAVSGTTILTLPATSGTVLTTASGTAATATNLAGGVAGAVPYQSGAGATGFSAAGTSGQLLQSNGVSAPTWITPSAGALVYLSTVTASASATVDIETTFNSTYDRYVIEAVGVTVSSSTDITFLARMKIGGSYLSTSTYSGHVSDCSSAAGTYSATQAVDEGGLPILGNMSNGGVAGKSANFSFAVSTPASTTLMKTAYWHGQAFKTDNTSRTVNGAGFNSGTAALTGIRFYASTGTISGTFRLYGIANS